MPLQHIEVRDIINARGLIAFENTLPLGTGLISSGTLDIVTDYNYAKVNLVANVAENKITLRRVANDSAGYDAANISTVDCMATLGKVTTPGYIYTGDFSGCVYYLYKTGPTEVTGVHAYSGSQAVTTNTGALFWKKKKQTMVVREFGPTDYFGRNPATLICRYPTRGEMDISTGEQSLAFLSVVDRTTVITYLFAAAGSPQGARIKRLIRTYRADY